MDSGADFSGINEAKIDMGSIYDRPDPRAYFNALQSWITIFPPTPSRCSKSSFPGFVRQRGQEEVCVLDLGCSYGVNAALLKHDLSMDELYDHWTHDELAQATPEEVVEKDHQFFSELQDPEDLKVIGIDQAENAVAFAEEIGLVDEGLPINLEEETLTADARRDIVPVDLMISTGCVGYVTEKSFERLMQPLTERRPAWIANFVLRMFPFDGIERALGDWGYRTEKLAGRYFRQRKFASAEEQEQVVEQLRSQDIDPTGLESEGRFVAEFYLSRPEAEARELPLRQLLAA